MKLLNLPVQNILLWEIVHFLTVYANWVSIAHGQKSLSSPLPQSTEESSQSPPPTKR